MTQTLVVDIGNTRIKWAYAHARALTAHGAAAHAGDIRACLDQAWTTLPKPARVVLASVAGERATDAACAWIHTRWQQEPLRLTASAVGYGIRNTYDAPEQLGADRWAALIGARSLRADAQCVIDCGTAISVSVLNASGVFVGGALLPGLATARACLFAHTQLPPATGNDTRLLARNTADAVAVGTLFGVAGAIERLLAEYRASVDPNLMAILTGGDAQAIAARLRCPTALVPDLVLLGLAHVAQAAP